jgi:hypothetical protein
MPPKHNHTSFGVRLGDHYTCHYKGLLDVGHLTLLGYSRYRSVAKDSNRNGPSCIRRIQGGIHGISLLN